MSAELLPPAVDVQELRVSIQRSGADIVDDVLLAIRPGEMLGLVGESGSGKTTIGTALLAHARRGAAITGGRVDIGGVDLLSLSAADLAQHRGRVVAYVPQDPGASLNPALRLGRQLAEPLVLHAPELSKQQRTERIAQALADVKLPSDRAFLRRYVHELSGGQQQRLAMAMAFILRPSVIVLDEPTTGLDVTTQSHILDTISRLCREHDVAALYVSHDLAVVAAISDRIAVAYAGRIVEIGSRDQLIKQPSHPYSRMLFATIPDISERRALPAIAGHAPRPGDRPPYCSFVPRCPHAIDRCREAEPGFVPAPSGQMVRCVRADELGTMGRAAVLQPKEVAAGEAILSVAGLDAAYQEQPILEDVSFVLHEQECLALVGESGSGKTTLARCIAGAGPRWSGDVRYRGELLAATAKGRTPAQRQELQYIFQSPYNSLNPRRTIAASLAAQLNYLFGTSPREARAKVTQTLERVALPAGFADRYPTELSGGERQRAAIARALVCDPRVIICDEITSALDVSVQASIVSLLEEIQREQRVATLFITHNLALVRTIADRAIVLNHGRIVESGPVQRLFDTPEHEYTRTLLHDTPSLPEHASDAPRPEGIAGAPRPARRA